MNFSITGQLVDIPGRRIYPAEVTINGTKIESIAEVDLAPGRFILPGFIDSHVHIESSMLVPSEFARIAVTHGTVSTVSDPHEIGNVLGVDGVNYMIQDGNRVPFKFYFGAPSCVPATRFETAGARISPDQIDRLLSRKEVKYLAEMMNWPGVLSGDPDAFAKIEAAQKHHKPVDGHAPGLMGDQARAYAQAGISTDHECFTAQEALDKLAAGMKIQIREGSAAKNFEALIDLVDAHYKNMMFCSDDKHPDNLVEGHINQLVVRAIKSGQDLFKVLQVACINPIEHYQLEVGQCRAGDPADFIVVDSLSEFKVLQTFIDGQKVANKGTSLIQRQEAAIINNFGAPPLDAKALRLKSGTGPGRIIQALDGQLITNALLLDLPLSNGQLISDPARDLLKIVVVNRYRESQPSVGMINGFGMKSGAIASSVAHDSHNVIAVGVDDEEITRAINRVIEVKGGVSVVGNGFEQVLPLPIAGLMSDSDGYQVARLYSQLDQLAKELGSTLTSPYMTLSFMALLVIPSLKISDQGLFDGEKFQPTSVFTE